MNDKTSPSDAHAPAASGDLARVWSAIKDIRFAMFTTRHENGHLHARPMTTQNSRLDEDDRLWFFMSRGHEAVDDLLRAPAVNVAYADADAGCYVSVAGEAMVVEDAARKRALWSAAAEAWFPGGPDDPDLALVCVRIAHADLWEARDGKLTQIAKMARAALTGQRPLDLGEHTRVDMRSS